jgi:hypothetical protein
MIISRESRLGRPTRPLRGTPAAALVAGTALFAPVDRAALRCGLRERDMRSFLESLLTARIPASALPAPDGAIRMTTVLRFVAGVLGSKWLFPVTFLAGLVAGVALSSRLDERDAARGEPMHAMFHVAWQPGDNGEPFGYTRLAELGQPAVAPEGRTFLLQPPAGELQLADYATAAYTVLDATASEQTIELRYSDEDYSTWSRYRATRSAIVPLHSGVQDPGYVYTAFGVALALTTLVYQAGRWMRRRLARSA